MQQKYHNAGKELLKGFSNWHFWGLLGWQDVRLRYRRSTLGPFWVTISMGIFVLALGLVYGGLFGTHVATYLPYLASGYLIWTFISACVVDGCNSLIEAEGFLKDSLMPLSLFIGRLIYRNFLIFLHNSVVVIAVMVWFHIPITLNIFFLAPALLLIMLNLAWLALLLGMLSARYRDFLPVVQSLIQVLFFISPIVWMPAALASGSHRWIIEWNPIVYFLDAARAPMYGQAPHSIDWVILIGFAIVGWCIAFWVYANNYKRVVYWL